MRREVAQDQEESSSSDDLHENWCEEAPEDGFGPCEKVTRTGIAISPTETLKLRRQMAAAARKKESVSLSVFLEMKDPEVEEECSTMATLFWVDGQVRGPAGAVMARNWRSWPQQHTLLFEGQVVVDMRTVCLQDVNEMLLKQVKMVYRKNGQPNTSVRS